MNSPVHLTIIIEAAEVERLTNLNRQGVLLYVHYREHQLQAVIASQALIEQELQVSSKENAAVKIAVLPHMSARVAMFFWGRQRNSLLH